MVLTFERPEKLNALDERMLTTLLASLRRAEREDVRVVVLLGAGRSFCAGANLAILGDPENGPARVAQFVDLLAESILRIARLPCPVVAGVQGDAVGGGAEIALQADLRVIGDDVRLAFPDTAIGSTPATVHSLLRLVGRSIANEVVLAGRVLHAPELESLGVAGEVVPASEVRARALTLAEAVRDRSEATSLRLAKEALSFASHATLATELRANVGGMLQRAIEADGSDSA